jgi:hypothetical protein
VSDAEAVGEKDAMVTQNYVATGKFQIPTRILNRVMQNKSGFGSERRNRVPRDRLIATDQKVTSALRDRVLYNAVWQSACA